MTFTCFCEIQQGTNQTFFFNRFEALNSPKFLYLHNEQWNTRVCVCVCARSGRDFWKQTRVPPHIMAWTDAHPPLEVYKDKTMLSDDTECVKDSKQPHMTVPSRRLWRSHSVCWQIKRRVTHWRTPTNRVRFGIDVYTKDRLRLKALEVWWREVRRSCCETALWMCVCVCARIIFNQVHRPRTTIWEKETDQMTDIAQTQIPNLIQWLQIYTVYFCTFLPTILLRMNFSQGTNQISVFDVIL